MKVSAIGLGGNAFGETVLGDEAIAIIRRAMDLGINFIDSAESYEGSEELIGKAVAGRRSEVVIATKGGWPKVNGVHTQPILSRRYLVQSVEKALQRLDTDYIDLYMVHRPDPITPLEETLWAVNDLVRQGKILYAGCSNFPTWQLVRALSIAERDRLAPWIAAENRWNLLQGLDDPHLLPTSRAFGVGIIPYTPLAAGVLTGKYHRGETPPRGTRLGDLPRMRERYTDAHIATVERLRPWAEARGRSTTETAIAWLLSHREVATVIVGARTVEQLEHNVKAATWSMSQEDAGEVELLVKS